MSPLTQGLNYRSACDIRQMAPSNCRFRLHCHLKLKIQRTPANLRISLKPNTHRRRRRDETVESRRVGVGGVYMNSRRLPTDSAMGTHNAAVGRDPVHNSAANCIEVRYDVTYDAACFNLQTFESAVWCNIREFL